MADPKPDNQTQNGSVLGPVLDFLRRHAPFDQMEAADLEFLAKRLELGFHARGAKITDPAAGPADRFIIIKQGRVRGETPSEDEQVSGNAWELVPGECFPIGALLAHRPVRTVHRAAEDCFCYELRRDDFEKLLKRSAAFNDFCTRRLASLLDQAQRRIQASTVTALSGDTALNYRVSDRMQAQTVCCTPGTVLGEALATMREHAVGSIIVVDEANHPLGIFTLKDLLGRVVLDERRLDTPIAEVMTPDPISIPADAYAFEAALKMAEHGVTHLCVVERGRLAGVLSERDLFALQQISIGSVSRRITGAGSVAAVAQVAGDIPKLVSQMIAQGAEIDQITQLITQLNDHIAQRVITLCEQDFEVGDIDYTWLAFGSEGRQEQTLKTDQDNGILFRVAEGQDAETLRQRLLPLARQINEGLAECGFPLCPGNIMAGNPECCLSAQEWRARFDRWIDQGTPEHLLKSAIFFDFRPITPPLSEVDELRAHLLRTTGRNSRFRRQMAANALRIRPPLGVIRDFKLASGGDHDHTLDLKTNGLTPFVDGARIIALGAEVDATRTVARLRGAQENGKLRKPDVDAWVDAYHYIQFLRMRLHAEQLREDRELSNRIDPDTLSELDRRILKEAFRQARKLQSKLALEYQL
jgi:CBS domain-containing protein